MTEHEENYLAICLQKTICPVCGNVLKSRVGSGSAKKGVFCSLDCYARWNEGVMQKKLQDRLKKVKPDE
jgi:hypothetical protein